MKTSKIGSIANSVTAITGPQFVTPSACCRNVRPIGSGATDSSSDIRNGHRYSFHSLTTVMTPTATMVGRDIGNTTRSSSCHHRAPSIRAASMISAGSDRKWLRIKKVPNATPPEAG